MLMYISALLCGWIVNLSIFVTLKSREGSVGCIVITCGNNMLGWTFGPLLAHCPHSWCCKLTRSLKISYLPQHMASPHAHISDRTIFQSMLESHWFFRLQFLSKNAQSLIHLSNKLVKCILSTVYDYYH